jgi:hypothetical protein
VIDAGAGFIVTATLGLDRTVVLQMHQGPMMLLHFVHQCDAIEPL